jgi:hypothetical protein
MGPSGQSGNRLFRCAPLLAACVFVFRSCMPAAFKDVIPVPALDNEGARACAKKWEKYGAYYEKHLTTFTATYSQYECNTRIETDLAMRILNNNGAQYATIPLPKHDEAMVTVFEPHLYDPSDSEVPVDRKAMKAAYRKTGKIVFPRVTAGSRITLKLAVSLPYYYMAWWHGFATPIPSRITGFAHIYSTTGVYDYKVSGSRYPFETDSTKSNWVQKARSWIIRGYEPRDSLAYMDDESAAEPFVWVRLREVRCWSRKYNSPKEIYTDSRFHSALIVADIAADTLLKTALKACAIGSQNPVTRAGKILDWIQRSIAVSAYSNNSNKNVLENKTGSAIQAASLCKVMMDKAGIDAEIVYAYSNELLLMDTSFVFFNEHFATPLLIVHFKTTDRVAYPYDAGWELGEYPSRFNGVLCIRPKEKKIEPLPPPLWGEGWTRSRMVIDLRSSPAVCRLTREFRLHSASSMRSEYFGLNKEQLRERFEKLIKGFNSSNRLVSFSFHDFNENPVGPFSMEIRFESDYNGLLSGDKNLFLLEYFLPEYFKDIFPGRTEDVVVHEGAVFIDEVEIIKIPGRPLSCDIKIKTLSNPLFTTSFSSGENDSSHIVQRTLNLKSVRIPAKDIGEIHKACVELNNIRNSSVSY